MKTLAPAVALVLSAAAAAQGNSWFTVVGEQGNSLQDTVEVDATSAVAFETMRVVKLRVNRGVARTGYDGLPFRSYQSTIVVDCINLRAWHRSLTLYAGPLWQGPYRVLEYKEADGRTLAFADMVPNPKERLIRAACSIALQSR